MKWNAFAVFVLVFAAQGLSACGSVNVFDANAYLAAGLRGKSWSIPVTLEPRPAAVSATEPRTFSRYDAASDGVHLFAGAAFFETDSSQFEGQILQYSSESGWASSGDGTFQYALSGSSVGLFKFIEDPLGARVLHLAGTQGDDTALHSSVFQGSQWEPLKSAGVTGFPDASESSSDISFHLDPVVGTFDSAARGHLAWNDGSNLQFHVWDSGESAGLDSAESFPTVTSALTALSSGGDATRDFKLVSDGDGWTCGFYRDSPGTVSTALKSTCFQGVKSSATTATLLEGVAEFDVAASGSRDEALMLVVARAAGSDSLVSFVIESDSDELTSDASASEVFDAYPENAFHLLDGSLDTTMGALLPGVKVAYLGEGQFVAVWAAVAESSTDSGTTRIRLYSAIYDRDSDSWSEPEWIGETEETYSDHIKYSGLSLKARSNGNAVLALSRVLTEGDSVSNDIRDVLVSRFDIQEGWMPLKALGDGCGRYEISGVDATRECTQPPAVALTESGDAVVVYVDQDEDGLFRLMASVFE